MLFKPNPVHALGLMQLCWGLPVLDALNAAYELWQGAGDRQDWIKFDDSEVVIFEDSVKGLQSGKSAQALLARHSIDLALKLIGISANPIKQAELEKIADYVVADINQIDWESL
jgi:beta-phosphoglucomutase-like phosphatase (HAD superfamily)